MILDLRTISIFYVMTPFVLGLLMLIYHSERKVYEGFGYWTLANFGLSLGYVFSSLPDSIPSFFSIVIGNVLIVYSTILIYEGVERFYRRPVSIRFNYLTLGIYAFLISYLTYFDANRDARGALSALTLCFLILHIGSRFFDVTIPGLERTSHLAGYTFFITALFSWGRALTFLYHSGPFNLLSDIIDSWFSMVFIVSIVTWTFSFFFLNNARLELDLEAARSKLDIASRTDPLTRLYNRRHFDEQARIEFKRAARSAQTNSLLLLDIDGFKSINDKHGHGAGDAILSSLSMVLRSELRPFDLIARYGGDEFVILLTDTDEDQAYAITERLRNRVALTPFIFDSNIFRITLSAGITSIKPGDVDLRSILKRGDRALYQAKAQGKNRVVVI